MIFDIFYDDKKDVFYGTSDSNGLVKGKACLTSSSKEFNKLKKLDILICSYTDPEGSTFFKLSVVVVLIQEVPYYMWLLLHVNIIYLQYWV